MAGEHPSSSHASSERLVTDEHAERPPSSNEEEAGRDVEGSSEDAIPPASSSTSQRAVATRPGTSDVPPWLRIGRFLAAPVMAILAVGIHFWLNVPDHPPPSPPDKAEKSSKKRPKAKPRSRRARFEPRSAEELERVWARYQRLDFAREPELDAWSRRTEAIVNRAVAVARKTAFEGAPEEPRVGVTGTECRTVRCRFVLRSPYAHELPILRNALKRLEVDGESVWRHFEAHRIPPPDGSPKDEAYLEIVVALQSDEIRSARLEVGEADGSAEPESDSETSDEAPGEEK